jgi:hypothetical protein
MNNSKAIFKAFKSKGLSIKADASQILDQFLQREDVLDIVLDAIGEKIEKQESMSL